MSISIRLECAYSVVHVRAMCTCTYTLTWMVIARHVAPRIEVGALRGARSRIDNPFNPKNIAPQMGEKSVSQSTVTSVGNKLKDRGRAIEKETGR